VLQTLRDQGLDDNTLVIFTSDNGYFWGEHGLGDKRALRRIAPCAAADGRPGRHLRPTL
jgi:arylsulfatase A-like enzyme